MLEGDLIILPLRMESLSDKPSLLEKLQIAEYAAIQELTIRAAKRGQAVMCSGANLIVKREVWLECEKDLHFEIPSGDDMFLLEAVKRCSYSVFVMYRLWSLLAPCRLVLESLAIVFYFGTQFV